MRPGRAWLLGLPHAGQPDCQNLVGHWFALAAAVLWGTFVSPKAKVKIPDYGRLVLEIVVFGSGVLALFAAGRPSLAWIIAVLVAIHLPLTFLFKQRGM
jgi:hypothetical protein